MYWHELMAWADVMGRQLKGPEPDPYTWDDYDSPEWRELRRKRDEARG